MSARMRDFLSNGFDQLRREPTARRIRAGLAGATVVDTTRAELVWEPGRVVPSYAVPASDIAGELLPVAAATPAGAADGVGLRLPDVTDRPVLDPTVPFAVHTTPGQVVTIRAGGQDRP